MAADILASFSPGHTAEGSREDDREDMQQLREAHPGATVASKQEARHQHLGLGQ